MQQFYDQLQKQSLIDLTKRAKGGIVIYPAIWLVMTLAYQVQFWSPLFFYINAIILCCIFVSRISHLMVFNNSAENIASKMRWWLVVTILIAGIHWGIMTAIILFQSDSSSLQYIWIITTMSLSIGGAVVLSISNKIRVLYPLFLQIPGIFVLILGGSSEQLILALCGIISLVYIHGATKVINADYWEGLKSRCLAEERAEKMENLSHTDQLTQLKNRMYFDQKFAEEWKRSSRLKSPLSILMLDLDYFKVINDSYGHMFGDECLRRVAESLLATIHRETDSVARYGGEEFVVLLPDTNPQDGKIIAARVLMSIANIGLGVDSHKIPLTCSIGIATGYAELDKNREILLKSADDALYLAKNKGRNRIQVGTTINAS